MDRKYKYKNIGIIGQGYVGSAIKHVINESFNVSTYDKFIKEKSTHHVLKELVYDSDIIFLCLPTPKVLPTACVNMTHEGPYTRMTEWKNFPVHGVNDQYTTITYEEPCDYKTNGYERYYPVKDIDGSNRIIYNSYKQLIKDNVTFIGRCGMYVYVDMHQAINSALVTADKFLEKNK